jgi:poly-gamma-glutamate synthesis protein (capsule biosynthesis protein)
MLDREVHRQAVLLGKGPDHPWDGGFAEITARTCCTADGGNAIQTRRTGRRGAVRRLLTSADVAVVNHEGPAPDDATYHPTGLVFTFDPALLEGVSAAGIDIVSLANNHIRNAGSEGVLQTRRNLRKAGIRTVGAGGDATSARRPTCLEPSGVRLCFLAYDAINTAVHAATTTRPGAAELRLPDVRSDIRRLRRDGADVVAVLPHWGVEYTTRVLPQQRRWARAMVRAGADVVLGAHSHVVGPVEFIEGVPVLYSLGDFLFDLPRFEETEEAVVAELTFQGDRLAQLELHPSVILDRSQVALLDPVGDGRVVLERMRRASARLAPARAD